MAVAVFHLQTANPRISLIFNRFKVYMNGYIGFGKCVFVVRGITNANHASNIAIHKFLMQKSQSSNITYLYIEGQSAVTGGIHHQKP